VCDFDGVYEKPLIGCLLKAMVTEIYSQNEREHSECCLETKTWAQAAPCLAELETVSDDLDGKAFDLDPSDPGRGVLVAPR
jgi:hypothetical protein